MTILAQKSKCREWFWASVRLTIRCSAMAASLLDQDLRLTELEALGRRACGVAYIILRASLADLVLNVIVTGVAKPVTQCKTLGGRKHAAGAERPIE